MAIPNGVLLEASARPYFISQYIYLADGTSSRTSNRLHRQIVGTQKWMLRCAILGTETANKTDSIKVHTYLTIYKNFLLLMKTWI